MDLSYSLTPVKDSDVVAFTYGFLPEAKAATEELVTQLENGDLLIEGWAADFDGIDREGENFIDGAFQKGLEEFLSGQAALCYHHKNDMCIGSVLDLGEVPGSGLHMKARVDFQEPTSPLRHIYDGIRKGSIKGLSTAGFFGRVNTANGPRINKVDLTEISVTPVAIHPKTQFSVVAGKALADLKPLDVPADDELTDEAMTLIYNAMDNLDKLFKNLGKRETDATDDETTTTV